MALDFYALQDTARKQLLFQLHDADLNALQDVFDTYQKKTGAMIDPYGITRIYPDHVELILDLLDKKLSIHAIRTEKLKQIRANFEQGMAGLLADGD